MIPDDVNKELEKTNLASWSIFEDEVPTTAKWAITFLTANILSTMEDEQYHQGAQHVLARDIPV